MSCVPHGPRFSVWIEGIGAWTPQLHDWPQLSEFLRTGSTSAAVPSDQRPPARRLPAGERRRAPTSVRVAVEVAEQAVVMSGREAAHLPSVFSCAHGDAEILDYTCATLADVPTEISPIRFHNSVHNAAAGYWTIATGCHSPSNAVAALEYSFAASLLEAVTLAEAERTAVLLVASDGPGHGPLADVIASTTIFGCAMVISPTASDRAMARLDLHLCDKLSDEPPGRHTAVLAEQNLSARSAILFEMLASDVSSGRHLQAGPHLGLGIRMEKTS